MNKNPWQSYADEAGKRESDSAYCNAPRQSSAKVHQQVPSPSSISSSPSIIPTITTFPLVTKHLSSILVDAEIFKRTQPPIALKGQKEKKRWILCSVCLTGKVIFHQKYFCLSLLAQWIISEFKCYQKNIVLLKKLNPNAIYWSCPNFGLFPGM